MKINIMNTDKKPEEKKKEIPENKIWNDSEVDILKKWGEIASSYRFLHDRAFRIFQVKNYLFTIPVIILSTISGTASFTIQSFPVSLQTYVPMAIGGVNLFVGILQTIAQFLRVSELAESHRVASISYGKFARNVTTELSLPPNNRSYNGIDFVQICRTEMDRLVEQSPIIPLNILYQFDQDKRFDEITKPDVLKISGIKEYAPSHDERMQKILLNAAEEYDNLHKNDKRSKVMALTSEFEKNVKLDPVKEFGLKVLATEDAEKNVENRNIELKEVQHNKIVSKILNNKNIDFRKVLESKINPKTEPKIDLDKIDLEDPKEL
jgi:hypothetical protein